VPNLLTTLRSSLRSWIAAVVAQWEAKVKEVKGSIKEIQKLNIKYSQEKVEAQQSAAESRARYISCCAVLAKEKLVKKHSAIKAAREHSKAVHVSGQKNLQTLVYKQTIANLEQKLASEKKHSIELSNTLKDLHSHNHDLKKHHAKTKLQERLSNMRKENAPEVDLDINAMHGSPLNNWMKNEIVQDLGAISGDTKAQTENILDKVKIQSLCALVDDIEEECHELLSSHLNNEPVVTALDDVRTKLAKANEGEELTDLKIKALEIEVEDLGGELEEKETAMYQIEERVSELEEAERKLKLERDSLLGAEGERDNAVAELKELKKKGKKGFAEKEEQLKKDVTTLKDKIKELQEQIAAEDSWREKDLMPTIARVQEEKIEMVKMLRQQVRRR